MKALITTFGVLILTTNLQAQIPDFTPATPLIGALLHNDLREAKRLLNEGANPNEGHFAGMPPLILAAVRQDVELVRLIAAKGADLNVRDRSGATALMWGAFNDTGDPSIVEALIRLGADPLAANKAGETALDWAMRRGDTPLVATLRKAGLSNTARAHTAAQKALTLLQKSGAQFSSVSKCYSCHHQALPQMAYSVARARGVDIDQSSGRQQAENAIAQLKPIAAEALTNRDRIPDPPIGVSYTLVALASIDYPADEVTKAMAQVVGAWQGEDGAFHSLPPMRTPLESSEFTATALSIRAIQHYGLNQGEQITRATRWLRTAKPRTTEDAAMQLLGLVWGNARHEAIRTSMSSLLALQREDGGWAQLPTLETDAYATGQALVALQSAGIDVSGSPYERGIGFLLRTQFPDGSWLVRTRSFPVQIPKDSGFPHGKHQWISAAGTSWAAMALMLSLPPQSGLPGESSTDAADRLGRNTEVGGQHALGHTGRN